MAASRQAGTRGKAAGTLGSLVILGIVAALVAGTAVSGSTVGALSAARVLPVPAAPVPAGTSVGVCPAPLELPEGTLVGSDPLFSPVSKTARTTISATVLSNLTGNVPPSALTPVGSGQPLKLLSPVPESSAPESSPPSTGKEQPSTGQRAASIQGVVPSTPTVLTAEPVGEQEPAAEGIMAYTAGDGDLRGLAAAGCQAPGNDFWLVGASTTVGASAVVNLVNPTASPATVSLDLQGPDGPLQAAGSRGLLVAAGESRSIVLAGLAANQERLAVRVRSTGAPVAATIAQNILRGLTPGGVDLITPSSPSSTSQIVTGIEVQDQAVTKKITAQEGYQGAGPALQVAVPGGADAVLDVNIFGPGGLVNVPGGGVVTVRAGTIGEIPLDFLPTGTYAAEVSSDVPVVAAGRLSRGTGSGAPVETAWAASGSRLGAAHLAVLPAGVDADSTLVFGAPQGRSELKLRGITPDGMLLEEKLVSLDGGTTVTLQPRNFFGDDVAAVLIGASGEPVYGAQVLRSDKGPGISVVPVPEASTARRSVPVILGF